MNGVGRPKDSIIAGWIAFTVRALDVPIPISFDPFQSAPSSPVPKPDAPVLPTLPSSSLNLELFQPPPMYLLSRTIETVPDL